MPFREDYFECSTVFTINFAQEICTIAESDPQDNDLSYGDNTVTLNWVFTKGTNTEGTLEEEILWSPHGASDVNPPTGVTYTRVGFSRQPDFSSKFGPNDDQFGTFSFNVNIEEPDENGQGGYQQNSLSVSVKVGLPK